MATNFLSRIKFFNSKANPNKEIIEAFVIEDSFINQELEKNS